MTMVVPLRNGSTSLACTLSLVGTQLRFDSDSYFLLSDIDNVILGRDPATQNNKGKVFDESEQHIVTLVFKAQQSERVSFCSNGVLSSTVHIKCEYPAEFYSHIYTLLHDLY